LIWIPEHNENVQISYQIEEGDYPVAPQVWQVQDNRFTRANSDLAALARDITRNSENQKTKLFALIGYAADMFGYEHPDEHFYENCDSVPAVCGTTKGSCVDINTFLLAAARCLEIQGQYIAGYWFHPDKAETHDMHCWLVFEIAGEVLFWDLAHHLKWGVENLVPGLNPAGGRRVAMSCGRGLEFETPNGTVTISHFSEPAWIMPDGDMVRPEMTIKVTD